MPLNGHDRSSGTRKTAWPRYDAAVTGMRNYWYPVAWSSQVNARPVPLLLLNERIVLLREDGRVHALSDQCPHRGIPLSVGRREFPGTWTCRYHGWTFDLDTGVLRAALTDGPDSPICGKVRVKTYPTAERAGLIWVYVGDTPARPVETDVPAELLADAVVVVGRIATKRGNWRLACENGFDQGHTSYLHRYGVLWTLFDDIPAWRRSARVVEPDGWVTGDLASVGSQGDYPGLGRWPQRHFWKRRSYRTRLSMRLPGVMRLTRVGKGQDQFIWWTPVDEEHYRVFLLYVTRARGLRAMIFRVLYQLVWKPLHHVQFNNQDAWMLELMPDSAPERLYRPDAWLTEWRRLCETALAAQDEGQVHTPARASDEAPTPI